MIDSCGPVYNIQIGIFEWHVININIKFPAAKISSWKYKTKRIYYRVFVVWLAWTIFAINATFNTCSNQWRSYPCAINIHSLKQIFVRYTTCTLPMLLSAISKRYILGIWKLVPLICQGRILSPTSRTHLS